MIHVAPQLIATTVAVILGGILCVALIVIAWRGRAHGGHPAKRRRKR